MAAFKIIRTPPFSSTPREISLAEAVERTLDDTFDEGDLERIRRRLDNHEKFIGKLVERLADSGHISLEFLQDALHYDMEVKFA